MKSEEWESGGKGAQRYERQENVVQEAGDSDLPVPPRLGRAEQENGWAPSSHIMISSQVISRSADPLSLGDLSRG